MVEHPRQARVFVRKQINTPKQVARPSFYPIPPCAVVDIHSTNERSTYATPSIDHVYPARDHVEHLFTRSQSVTRARANGRAGRRAPRA